MRLNRLKSHLAHQPADPLMIYFMSLVPQTLRYPGNPVKGRLRELFVNQIHNQLVIAIIPYRFIII